MEMNKLEASHADAAIKGLALGIVTYVAAKVDLAPELIAVLLPAVAAGLSVLSTKIGDKNTALLLQVANKALEAAPVVAKAPAKKAVAKKAPAKKAAK
jgi:hypothetical protein